MVEQIKKTHFEYKSEMDLDRSRRGRKVLEIINGNGNGKKPQKMTDILKDLYPEDKEASLRKKLERAADNGFRLDQNNENHDNDDNKKRHSKIKHKKHKKRSRKK